MIPLNLTREQAEAVVYALEFFTRSTGPIEQAAFAGPAADLAALLRDRAGITTADLRERFAQAAEAESTWA